MKTMAIVAGILLLIWLIGQIRIGGRMEYTEEGLKVRLRLGKVWKTVYPASPKKEKPGKAAGKGKKPAKQSDPEGEKKGGSVKAFLDLFPVGAELVGKLIRKIRIDLLTVHVIWADRDPAKTAIGYGAANGAVGLIYPVFDHNFRIKKSDIRVDADFTQAQPSVYVNAALSLTLGQLISLVIRYGFRALRIWKGNDPKQIESQ